MSLNYSLNTNRCYTGTLPVSGFGDNTQSFVCGWFYPTTLTATRCYWGSGTVAGVRAAVDATTSEIRMYTNNTTDGEWLTSGAGITTNKWWFIAWLASTENTTVPGQWRVWVGDEVTPPAEVTITNPVVRSGNYTALAAFQAGNQDSGSSLAWQGDIGWVSYIVSNTVSALNILPCATSGVISNDNAEIVRSNLVYPLWKGLAPSYYSLGNGSMILHMPFDKIHGNTVFVNGSTALTRTSVTNNGVSNNSNQPPTAPPHDWPIRLHRVRR